MQLSERSSRVYKGTAMIRDNEFEEYRGSLLERIIYKFHPMMVLPKGGSLEWYEDGKWIPARDRKSSLENQVGFDVNKMYEEWIINLGYEDRILGMREMKIWARWAQKTVFTLLGLFITAVSLVTGMPLGLLVGVPMSILSLYLKYVELSKPLFPPRKDANMKKHS